MWIETYWWPNFSNSAGLCAGHCPSSSRSSKTGVYGSWRVTESRSFLPRPSLLLIRFSLFIGKLMWKGYKVAQCLRAHPSLVAQVLNSEPKLRRTTNLKCQHELQWSYTKRAQRETGRRKGFGQQRCRMPSFGYNTKRYEYASKYEARLFCQADLTPRQQIDANARSSSAWPPSAQGCYRHPPPGPEVLSCAPCAPHALLFNRTLIISELEHHRREFRPRVVMGRPVKIRPCANSDQALNFACHKC